MLFFALRHVKCEITENVKKSDYIFWDRKLWRLACISFAAATKSASVNSSSSIFTIVLVFFIASSVSPRPQTWQTS